MSAQYDIVHFTNYLMPFRKNKRSKYVVTVHDLVSFFIRNRSLYYIGSTADS